MRHDPPLPPTDREQVRSRADILVVWLPVESLLPLLSDDLCSPSQRIAGSTVADFERPQKHTKDQHSNTYMSPSSHRQAPEVRDAPVRQFLDDEMTNQCVICNMWTEHDRPNDMVELVCPRYEHRNQGRLAEEYGGYLDLVGSGRLSVRHP